MPADPASSSDAGERRLPGGVRLWFGALGGLAAWGVAVLAAYPTVAAVCDAGASKMWLHALRWAAMVVAVTATAVAYRSWRRAQAVDDAPAWSASRARFMGLSGVMLSLSGLFLLLVEDLATWVIDPCW